MQKTIEVVYEKGVLRPLESVELLEGEHVKIKLEEKKRRELDFEPIKLQDKISIKKIIKRKMILLNFVNMIYSVGRYYINLI